MAPRIPVLAADARGRLARLVAVIAAGERLAARVSARQAGAAPIGRIARSLAAHARQPAARVLMPIARRVIAQERGHAALGEAAFRALGGRWEASLAEYREVGARLARRVAELQDDGGLDGDLAWAGIDGRLEEWTR